MASGKQSQNIAAPLLDGRVTLTDLSESPVSKSPPHPASSSHLAPYWERRIKQQWADHTRHCLHICAEVAGARRHLARGEWSGLFRLREMPFSKREGEMRLRIWEAMGGLIAQSGELHQQFSIRDTSYHESLAPNAQDLARLPDKITVLHVLAELDLACIRHCLAEGLIHSGLNDKAARSLVAKLKGRTLPEPAANLARRLRNFRRFILENLPVMTVSERNAVSSELQELLELMTANSN